MRDIIFVIQEAEYEVFDDAIHLEKPRSDVRTSTKCLCSSSVKSAPQCRMIYVKRNVSIKGGTLLFYLTLY